MGFVPPTGPIGSPKRTTNCEPQIKSKRLREAQEARLSKLNMPDVPFDKPPQPYNDDCVFQVCRETTLLKLQDNGVMVLWLPLWSGDILQALLPANEATLRKIQKLIREEPISLELLEVMREANGT